MKAALSAVLFMLALSAAAAQTRQPSNRLPSVKLSATPQNITLKRDCGVEPEPPIAACAPTSQTVSLSADASDPDGDTLSYTYSTTGGRVSGEGSSVTLDLSGIAPGVYTVKVKVDDGRGGVAFDTAAITAARCSCPEPLPLPLCPTISMTCPDVQEPRRLVTLDGGYRESLTVEAWVVPFGATPPKPTPTVFPRGRDRR